MIVFFFNASLSDFGFLPAQNVFTQAVKDDKIHNSSDINSNARHSDLNHSKLQSYHNYYWNFPLCSPDNNNNNNIKIYSAQIP